MKTGRSSKVRIHLERGPHLAIGLMSGTSHDGVSAAVVRLDERAHPPAQSLAFRTFAYPAKFRARLLELSSMKDVGAPAVSTINFELGKFLGEAARKIAEDARMPLPRISFIGSHGHTIFHLPPRTAKRGQTPSTMQIGESSVIAAMTGLPVVADFRPMDLALGGEAAPLAPLGHLWLFGDAKRGRVIQNIGGIGNATYLKPRPTLDDPSLIAFDTGPGGMLIDGLMTRLSSGRATMDRDGKAAARGRVNERLLSELMRHRYFRRRPPKSTGREEFGLQLLEELEGRAEAVGIGGDDLVATITAFTARSIADAVEQFVMPLGRVDQLIATGGGSRNPTLLRMIG
ncbi:MAG TPA: anhydro-N-acetylmuramic acid kinase, partial [Candidatus Binataceae bacterium]|nr:anhydro-N-acetylmuramic acid kinase [Candidatus Binataceae bacterium]